MTTGKTAAQVAHAVRGLNIDPNADLNIVVLHPISDAKFFNIINDLVHKRGRYYVHRDKGLTEVAENEATAVAYITEE